MPAPEISIVIPCLNEARSLPVCLDKANNFLSQNTIYGEIIVVDNGSTDDSVAVAKQKKAEVVFEPEKGYGNALMTGIKHARGRYVIMGDADDSYDFGNLSSFIEELRKGYDVVNGNRFTGKIQKKAMPFLHRYLGNPVLNFIARNFFSIHVGDFQCGLRAFDREKILQLDLRATGMEFSSEMIVKAALAKLKLTEVPVTLYPDKRNRPSHLRTWRDGWRYLRFLLLYSPKWLFLLPGIFLLLLGLFGSIVLVTGPVQLGNKKLDVHTLVYTSAFFLIGFQFIAFYFFSRLYAATHYLLPHQQIFLEKFQRSFQLEKGLVVGLVLFIAGVVFLVKSVLYWKNVHFGDLDPFVVLRWVVPSATLLVLGLQVVISSFYLSFLTIRSRDRKL
jgi:glycosyltransferase involved in cell wall biosynthesis